MGRTGTADGWEGRSVALLTPWVSRGGGALLTPWVSRGGGTEMDSHA